jgi:hypothetical protein
LTSITLGLRGKYSSVILKFFTHFQPEINEKQWGRREGGPEVKQQLVPIDIYHIKGKRLGKNF